MNDDFDIEKALRASLAEHAKRAPSGDALAEQIIAAADHPRPVSDPYGRRPRRWRAWTLPLIASGASRPWSPRSSAISQIHHDNEHAANTPTPTLTTPAPSSSPTSAPSTSAPSTTSPPPSRRRRRPSRCPVHRTRPGRVPGGGHDVRQHGQRLGAGQRAMLQGQVATVHRPAANRGRRSELGEHQESSGECLDNTSCTAAPCVNQIRFANNDVGYAFGPDALFMTTDGGAEWTRQAGGATSLEIENGTVLRVTSEGAVQIADVGTDAWRASSLPGSASVVRVVPRAGPGVCDHQQCGAAHHVRVCRRRQELGCAWQSVRAAQAPGRHHAMSEWERTGHSRCSARTRNSAIPVRSAGS